VKGWNSDHSTHVCRLITKDLDNYKDGITLEMLEQSFGHGVHYQIVDGSVYREERCPFPARWRQAQEPPPVVPSILRAQVQRRRTFSKIGCRSSRERGLCFERARLAQVRRQAAPSRFFVQQGLRWSRAGSEMHMDWFADCPAGWHSLPSLVVLGGRARHRPPPARHRSLGPDDGNHVQVSRFVTWLFFGKQISCFG